jgi:hypothetical protein
MTKRKVPFDALDNWTHKFARWNDDSEDHAAVAASQSPHFRNWMPMDESKDDIMFSKSSSSSSSSSIVDEWASVLRTAVHDAEMQRILHDFTDADLPEWPNGMKPWDTTMRMRARLRELVPNHAITFGKMADAVQMSGPGRLERVNGICRAILQAFPTIATAFEDAVRLVESIIELAAPNLVHHLQDWPQRGQTMLKWIRQSCNDNRSVQVLTVNLFLIARGVCTFRSVEEFVQLSALKPMARSSLWCLADTFARDMPRRRVMQFAELARRYLETRNALTAHSLMPSLINIVAEYVLSADIDADSQLLTEHDVSTYTKECIIDRYDTLVKEQEVPFDVALRIVMDNGDYMWQSHRNSTCIRARGAYPMSLVHTKEKKKEDENEEEETKRPKDDMAVAMDTSEEISLYPMPVLPKCMLTCPGIAMMRAENVIHRGFRDGGMSCTIQWSHALPKSAPQPLPGASRTFTAVVRETMDDTLLMCLLETLACEICFQVTRGSCFPPSPAQDPMQQFYDTMRRRDGTLTVQLEFERRNEQTLHLSATVMLVESSCLVSRQSLALKPTYVD